MPLPKFRSPHFRRQNKVNICKQTQTYLGVLQNAIQNTIWIQTFLIDSCMREMWIVLFFFVLFVIVVFTFLFMPLMLIVWFWIHFYWNVTSIVNIWLTNIHNKMVAVMKIQLVDYTLTITKFATAKSYNQRASPQSWTYCVLQLGNEPSA